MTEGSRKYAHPLLEQPLKFITHGHIFESLRYNEREEGGAKGGT